MKYIELKIKHQEEFDSFPIAFAFNKKQLAEGLNKLGITAKEAASVFGGGFIRKTDKAALLDLIAKHTKESAQALEDDDFMVDAIEYELGNHEYCITYDADDALSAVGVSLDDERVNRLFQIAKKKYLNWCYENDNF